MCGTGGIIGTEDTYSQGSKIHAKLQGRGEDAAGYGIVDENGIRHIIKKEGLVNQVFNGDNSSLEGPVAVWHTRYRTIGGLGEKNAQPHSAGTLNDRYTLVCSQNGNIQNCDQLRKQLGERGFYFKSENDGEVIAKTFAHFLGKHQENGTIESIVEACEKTVHSLKGAYTVVIALYDRKTKDHYLVSFTDPRKIRPGVVGKKEKMYAVASESNALELNGFEQIRDLLPGEVFIVRRSDMQTFSKVVRSEGRAHCFFEYVYFGDPNHVGEGLEINETRSRLGKQLALENMDLKAHTDIVVPMPYTSIPAAAGFAEAIGKPVRQGIKKDRYVGRIFIKPGREERARSADENIEVIVSVVHGKRVTVVDDSHVKGNQAPRGSKRLYKAGAIGINWVFTCEQIINVCDCGIYIPQHYELAAYDKEKLEGLELTPENLLKAQRTIQEIEQAHRIKSGVPENIPIRMRYISHKGLVKVLTSQYTEEEIQNPNAHLLPRIGAFDESVLEQTRTENDFCMSCITHNDPTADDIGGLVD